MAGTSSEDKSGSYSATAEAAVWQEVSSDSPCPVCYAAEDCRIQGNTVACVRIDNGWGKAKRSQTGTQYVEYDLKYFRWVPPPDQALALLRRHFFNRTDRVAFLAPWGEPCPCFGDKDNQLEGLLRAHLTGKCILRVHSVSKKKPEGDRTKQGKYWIVAKLTGVALPFCGAPPRRPPAGGLPGGADPKAPQRLGGRMD
jgi:hypothetical protein